MWMNEGEIEQAMERFQSHPVLGKGARFLGAFRDEVNAHSDGWAHWPLPGKAADKLMTLLYTHLWAHTMWPRPSEPTFADLKKAYVPIRAFYTRVGHKAGLTFPPLETDTPKAEKVADETKITRTVTLLLAQVYNCRGVEGFDDLLEEKLGHLFSDVSWRIVGHDDNSITLEVSGQLEQGE
jgi:hypothetical protein